jgi:hypothetical protein
VRPTNEGETYVGTNGSKKDCSLYPSSCDSLDGKHRPSRNRIPDARLVYLYPGCRSYVFVRCIKWEKHFLT